MNKTLIEVVNKLGMVVREIKDGGTNKFGNKDLITIEGMQYRITFESNVLNGINYFKIVEIKDLYKNRIYISSRYFHKFISLIGGINGKTFIELNKMEVK